MAVETVVLRGAQFHALPIIAQCDWLTEPVSCGVCSQLISRQRAVPVGSRAYHGACAVSEFGTGVVREALRAHAAEMHSIYPQYVDKMQGESWTLCIVKRDMYMTTHRFLTQIVGDVVLAQKVVVEGEIWWEFVHDFGTKFGLCCPDDLAPLYT